MEDDHPTVRENQPQSHRQEGACLVPAQKEWQGVWLEGSRKGNEGEDKMLQNVGSERKFELFSNGKRCLC